MCSPATEQFLHILKSPDPRAHSISLISSFPEVFFHHCGKQSSKQKSSERNTRSRSNPPDSHRQQGFGVQSGAIAFAWVTLMSPVQATNVWVPVCCDRVMRYNMFVPKGGSAYGALVCTVCSKNITFELEPLLDLSAYGEGGRILNMLGSPKPPKANRPKAAADERLKDQTL
jgi:hypothetical protein